MIPLNDFFNRREWPPKILYLGDSVLERTSSDDKDKTLLGEMLKTELFDLGRVEYLSHPGYHLDVYYHLLRAVAQMKDRPEWVILPINLRSFSPTWYQNPLWRFDQTIEILKQYIADPSKPMAEIPSLSEKDVSFEAFDAMAVHFPQSALRTIGQFRKLIKAKPRDVPAQRARLKEIFLFHYLYVLDPTHPFLTFLRQITKLSQSEGIALFLYFTPINFEAGTRCLGEFFVSRVCENKQKIRKVLDATPLAVHWRDYSMLFGSDHFFTPNNATEHLRGSARQELAQTIAAEVRTVHR